MSDEAATGPPATESETETLATEDLSGHVETEQRATPLELFFDLVFVFAFTQVTGLMSENPTWEGSARVCSSWRRSGGRGAATPGSTNACTATTGSRVSASSRRWRRC